MTCIMVGLSGQDWGVDRLFPTLTPAPPRPPPPWLSQECVHCVQKVHACPRVFVFMPRPLPVHALQVSTACPPPPPPPTS